MQPIPVKEAMEILAQSVQTAPPDLLVEFFAELDPAKPLPDQHTVVGLVGDLSERVRNHIAPQEVVDLWNMLYPLNSHVYYDEEADILCPVRQPSSRYANY